MRGSELELHILKTRWKVRPGSDSGYGWIEMEDVPEEESACFIDEAIPTSIANHIVDFHNKGLP